MTVENQLVSPPESTGSAKYEQLGYMQVRDGVLKCFYAFVAYKETEPSGAWRVRIRSSQTTGVVFEPAMMTDRALAAADDGKPYFTWGAGIDPSTGDPRKLEYRVHVANGKPSEIEIVAQMRKGDNSPGDAQSLKFKWPA
ncbi:MAG: hypothetical protein QM770_12110 [Tepidisphaeraceae bacterium]